MTNLVIEKNIPMPSFGMATGFLAVLKKMQIGDSVFIDGKKVSDVSSRKSIVQKKTGFLFTARTVEGGVRIWRIE